MENPICYCGHDCSRCRTYLATVRGDKEMQKEAHAYYENLTKLELPTEEIRCCGGRTEELLFLVDECPFRECCRMNDFDSCKDCDEYPCSMLKNYQDQYVNKSNQVEK